MIDRSQSEQRFRKWTAILYLNPGGDLHGEHEVKVQDKATAEAGVGAGGGSGSDTGGGGALHWPSGVGGQLRCYMGAEHYDNVGTTATSHVDVSPDGGKSSPEIILFHSFFPIIILWKSLYKACA